MASFEQPSEAQKRGRKARRTRQLGSNQECVDCGESRAWALVTERSDDVPERRRISCRNCRAKTRWKGDPVSNRKCAWCPESHPATLEWHHIYGRATNAQIGVWLCKNDHAVATEWQRDLRVSFDAPANVLDHVINTLRADAAYLNAIADAKVISEDIRQLAAVETARASQLAAFRAALNKRDPQWSELPEATP